MGNKVSHDSFFDRLTVRPSLAWLFYAGLFLFLIADKWYATSVLTPEWVRPAIRICNYVGQGLLGLRLLTLAPRYPRYVIGCLCLLAVLRFSYIISDPRTPNVFQIALVVAASREADIRTALKVYLAFLLFWLIACPLNFAAGYAGNVIKHIGQFAGKSLGFVNPNYLAIFTMTAVFLGLYLRRERRVAPVWIVCWAVAALVFVITLSRTSTFLLLAMPVLYWAFVKSNVPRPALMAALPAVCLVLSVTLACIYGPGYGEDTFESRFSIPAMAFGREGLSAFGQYCGLAGWFRGKYPYNLNIDNSYLSLFVSGGVVTGTLAVAFLSHLLYLIGRKGDKLLSAVACCIVLSGVMEQIPFDMRLTFLPLLYMPLVEEYAPGFGKKVRALPYSLLAGAVLCAFMPWQPRQQVQSEYGTVGDIKAPEGFTEVDFDPDSFAGYVASLPLARPDSVVALYRGEASDSLKRLCYRVVEMPLIDKYEQCADICMRLWAEYNYRDSRFRKISFVDTRGKTLRYRFGACRSLFERYLEEVFAWSNSESMRSTMSVRKMDDLSPGDVFVYDKYSRPGIGLGHAVMVAGVAEDPVSGKRAVLLVQGSTPASDLHVVANPDNPALSPWHLLRESGQSPEVPVLEFGQAVYYEDDIRYFED